MVAIGSPAAGLMPRRLSFGGIATGSVAQAVRLRPSAASIASAPMRKAGWVMGRRGSDPVRPRPAPAEVAQEARSRTRGKVRWSGRVDRSTAWFPDRDAEPAYSSLGTEGPKASRDRDDLSPNLSSEIFRIRIVHAWMRVFDAVA